MTVKINPAPRKLTDLSEYGSTTQNLPYWARSTNPIVRRHLGLYWRTVPPEVRPFISIYIGWAVLIMLGIVAPALFGATMISYLASIMVLPLAGLYYGWLLLQIAVDSAAAMQQEMTNNTFLLLRTTPMSLSQIFLGKVAAAMWRRMDDIVLLAQLNLIFSPPVLFTIYSGLFPFSDSERLITPLMTLVGATVVVYRMIAEPIMIGVLAVFIGIVVEGRSRAISSAVALGAFYFLLLNLMSRLPVVRGFQAADGSLIPANGLLVILFDFVLPVLLPLLIIFGLLRLSEYMITRD